MRLRNDCGDWVVVMVLVCVCGVGGVRCGAVGCSGVGLGYIKLRNGSGDQGKEK